MAKAIPTFLLHRGILLVVAFLSLAFHSPFSGDGFFPRIPSYAYLGNQFMDRISDVPEMATLKKVQWVGTFQMFQMCQKPFIWAGKWLVNLTGLSPMMGLIVLSNLFFLLFLSELIALLSRMVTTDVATSAAVLLIFWPTSYELSLGSSLSLTCFLATASIRFALDGGWLQSGVTLGLLALYEPLVLGLIPLLGYMFWYFQRHFSAAQMVRRGLFFLLPFVIALIWNPQVFTNIGQVMTHSALANLFTTAVEGKSFGWTFTHSLLGQTLTIAFFAVGAVASVINNTVLLHRAIPVVMLVVLLLFSPYGTVASRAPVAGICLEGIAGSTRPLTRLTQAVLVFLSVYEVFAIFG